MTLANRVRSQVVISLGALLASLLVGCDIDIGDPTKFRLYEVPTLGAYGLRRVDGKAVPVTYRSPSGDMIKLRGGQLTLHPRVDSTEGDYTYTRVWSNAVGADTAAKTTTCTGTWFADFRPLQFDESVSEGCGGSFKADFGRGHVEIHFPGFTVKFER